MSHGIANVKLRRPHFLFIERRAAPASTLRALLSADAAGDEWIALAPHLDAEVPLDSADLALLDSLVDGRETERDPLADRFGAERIDRLLAAGLLLGDHAEHGPWRTRDSDLQRAGWWGPAALAQAFGRWDGVDLSAEIAQGNRRGLTDMIAEQGLPPPAVVHRCHASAAVPLPLPAHTGLDALLRARATCRNFDVGAGVALVDLAAILHRVFGAQATQELAPGAVMLKKNSPSGGGLHPVEAYVLAQRVQGLATGLYHYDGVAHALEPMQLLPAADLAPLAHELVAGQAWFADAPVLVLMAARFERNFWKYRRHAKAWKVVLLDAGHLSQNFQLSATEQGYGAFVTGAINDRCAERAFKFDGLSTGAIAVCGMGRRAAELATMEFDPLGLALRV